MRAVIQRVTHASVTINGQVKSAIQQGFLILLGVCDEDTMEDVEWLTKKIAALFIGVLILSGITYAAIHMISSNPQSEQVDQTVAVDNTQPLTINAQQSASADSTIIQPVVFENAELGRILQEIASFYQCEVVYKKEKTKRVRLFFTWDKKQSLDQVVETFNKFERFHIAKENQKLIVE